MPRISIWQGEDYGNDLKDFCHNCYKDAIVSYEDENGELPDTVAIDDAHPDYDNECYRCEICGEVLTSKDNEPCNALF